MDEKENLNNEDNLEASSMFGGSDAGESDQSMFQEEPDETEEALNSPEETAVTDIEPDTLKSAFEEENIEQAQTPQKEPETIPIEPVEDIQDDNEDENQPTDIVTVRPVKFKKFEPTEPVRAIKKNLDIMQDVLMHISVELGRTKSSIKEVMDLEEGSVVELDKIAGEQVEIYVNGKIVAKGEVIVIEDKFGVRVTSTNLPKNPNP